MFASSFSGRHCLCWLPTATTSGRQPANINSPTASRSSPASPSRWLASTRANRPNSALQRKIRSTSPSSPPRQTKRSPTSTTACPSSCRLAARSVVATEPDRHVHLPSHTSGTSHQLPRHPQDEPRILQRTRTDRATSSGDNCLAGRITTAFTAHVGNNRCHSTFLPCGDGVPMSTYLDALIRSVEAEAAEEEVYISQLRSSNHRSQHSRRNLNRILQRLRTLKDLRKN
jgi:hypothetical protein